MGYTSIPNRPPKYVVPHEEYNLINRNTDDHEGRLLPIEPFVLKAMVETPYNTAVGGGAGIHAISYSIITYDEGGFFDVGQPTRLTIPEDGLYMAGMRTVQSGGSNWNGNLIVINGNPLSEGSDFYNATVAWVAFTTGFLQPIGLRYLQAGDYIEAKLDKGASNAQVQSNFWIQKMAG